jgi:HlyD family secretion protein
VVGVIAKNDFEKARDNLQSAEIRGKHATEAGKLESSDIDLQLRSRREQLARQKLRLDEAKRRVDELSVRAPMDGVVGSLAVVDRTVVPANAPLMTLVDLAQLDVELGDP